MALERVILSIGGLWKTYEYTYHFTKCPSSSPRGSLTRPSFLNEREPIPAPSQALRNLYVVFGEEQDPISAFLGGKLKRMAAESTLITPFFGSIIAEKIRDFYCSYFKFAGLLRTPPNAAECAGCPLPISGSANRVGGTLLAFEKLDWGASGFSV